MIIFTSLKPMKQLILTRPIFVLLFGISHYKAFIIPLNTVAFIIPPNWTILEMMQLREDFDG